MIQCLKLRLVVAKKLAFFLFGFLQSGSTLIIDNQSAALHLTKQCDLLNRYITVLARQLTFSILTVCIIITIIVYS